MRIFPPDDAQVYHAYMAEPVNGDDTAVRDGDVETAVALDLAPTQAAELAWSEADEVSEEPVSRPWIWVVLAVAGLALLASLGWAGYAFSGSDPPPRASTAGETDRAFWAALQSHGMAVDSQRATAIVRARKACVDLDGGTTRAAMVASLASQTGWSRQDAGLFLFESARAYCPQYADIVR